LSQDDVPEEEAITAHDWKICAIAATAMGQQAIVTTHRQTVATITHSCPGLLFKAHHSKAKGHFTISNQHFLDLVAECHDDALMSPACRLYEKFLFCG
jgi:NAD-dependent dihydropyrimidine dehydrogenase PreA subunit